MRQHSDSGKTGGDKMEIGAEERINDNCIILHHPDSPDLFILFCAVDIKPGQIPADHRVFHPKILGCNVVVVNDSSKNWYLNGIPKLGNNREETLSFLQNLKKRLLGKNGAFMCYGNSMGAYGAVLFGSLLNADFILAPGMEALVRNPVGIATHWVEGKFDRPDLRAVIGKSSSLIHILAGEECPGDYIGMYRLMDLPNVFVQTVVNMQHGVTAYLALKVNERAVLREYLQRVKDMRRLEKSADEEFLNDFRKKYFFRDIIYDCDHGEILQNKKAGVYLYSTQLMLQIGSLAKGYVMDPRKVRQRIAKLKEIIGTTGNPIIKSYLLFAIGKLKHRYLQDRQGLIEACLAAYALNGESRSIPQYLSSLYRAIKNWPECLYWANEAISNRRFFRRPAIEKPSGCYNEYLEACENLFSSNEQKAFLKFAQSWLKIPGIPESEGLKNYIGKYEGQ